MSSTTVTVYSLSSGEIVRTVSCPISIAALQAGAGEGYVLGASDEATHVVNGVFETRAAPPAPRESLMARIRTIRNAKLTACDWTQLPDAPADKAEWAAYRQALRDMPGQCDPNNPIWPVPPV